MDAQTDAPAGAPSSGRRQTVLRLGWGVADQAVSSLSNFLLGIYVAKALGAAGLGAFSLAYLTYSVVLNASRGLSTDSLVVRFSGPADSRWRGAVGSASGTALVAGAAAGLCSILAGLLLLRLVSPSTVGVAFIALGFGLPGLMLQDSWRYAFFAVGRGSQALLNDLAWTVLMIGALVWAYLSGTTSVGVSLLVFGGTATVAALLGIVQTRIRPRALDAVHWVSTHRQLALRYLPENVSSSGASQVRAFVLGGVAGLVAVGHVRATEMLIGPFLVVLMGAAQVAVPEAARAVKRGPAALRRFCLGFGLALATASLLWGATILVVFPLGPGDMLLGSLWGPAHDLAPGVIVVATAACLTVGASSGLRGLGQSKRSLRSQLLVSLLYLVGSCGGAIRWGAAGAVWGAAIGGVAGAIVWWVQLNRGIREHHWEPDGSSQPRPPAPQPDGPAPRLTIGLPVRNGERYLAESLDCLLAQRFSDFELVISDNGSTDGTAAICRRYAARDRRIRYLRQEENIGSAANHNVLIHAARGELFKWASDDDLYHPDLIRRCVEALDANDDCVLAHCFDAFIDANGTALGVVPYVLDTASTSPARRLRSLLFDRGGNDIYGVIRTEALRRTHLHGGYPDADRVLVAELALYGRFHEVPAVLYFRRDQPDRAERATRSLQVTATDPDPQRDDRLRNLRARRSRASVGGYLRSVHSAPLSQAQKLACYAHVAAWVVSRANPFHRLGATRRHDPAVRERVEHAGVVRFWLHAFGVSDEPVRELTASRAVAQAALGQVPR